MSSRTLKPREAVEAIQNNWKKNILNFCQVFYFSHSSAILHGPNAKINPPYFLSICVKARVFVVAGPREKFSETEINHMNKFLEEGGAILVLLWEGGEKR